ncbi:hypothetical protein AVEN_73895-1 [Araneus ventricosus]|uniref:Reverse transcriptase domain-containing protein n=1 Tax=Araneus ventricosus TaxID=182803 RepID=A0A4Y2QWI9_ARAVE|nr:hypothetical protein AVEN_73895-1 [Araneus ventricosus]
MVAYKVARKLARLLDSFLRDRSVVLSDGSTWKYNIGVPQGSCMGPVFWLFIIDELSNHDNSNENAYLQACVDDVALLMQATASYHFKEISREIILKLESWAQSFNLRFSPIKSNYIMFKNNSEITHFPGLYLYGNRIVYDQNLKYLGLIFDKNLSFMPHLNLLQPKICKVTEKVRRIPRATCCLKPIIVKEIYLIVLEKIMM